MKRKFLIFISLVLVMMSVLGACKDADEIITNDESNTSDTVIKEGLLVNDIKITEYTLVYANSETAVKHFNSKLSQQYQTELTPTKDFSDGCQIFIGIEAAYGDVADFYAACDEGMIGFDGKNVYLLAKDDKGIFSVIDAFFAKATAGDGYAEISVTQNESVAFTSDNITVMSYNVLYEMYYDDNQEKPRDMADLADFIKEQNADVFGTQETLEAHKAAILSAMPNYDCYEGVVLKGGAKLSNMIFWNADKFKAVSKGFQYLTDTPYQESKIDESNGYRGFSYVVLESLSTKKQFLFVNVHLTYRDSDGNSGGEAVLQARFKQAQHLVKFLENKKYEDMPIILVGDFNSVPGSAALNAIENANRVDRALTVAKTKGDIGSTLAKDSHTERDSKYIFDHIFVTSDRITTEYFTVVDKKINDSGAQRYPSDHLPVLAKIVIC